MSEHHNDSEPKTTSKEHYYLTKQEKEVDPKIILPR